jgi:hypothetical protein
MPTKGKMSVKGPTITADFSDAYTAKNQAMAAMDRTKRTREDAALPLNTFAAYIPLSSHTWEYRVLILSLRESDNIETRLNELGVHGWHIVDTQIGEQNWGLVVIMERPLDE